MGLRGGHKGTRTGTKAANICQDDGVRLAAGHASAHLIAAEGRVENVSVHSLLPHVYPLRPTLVPAQLSLQTPAQRIPCYDQNPCVANLTLGGQQLTKWHAMFLSGARGLVTCPSYLNHAHNKRRLPLLCRGNTSKNCKFPCFSAV